MEKIIALIKTEYKIFILFVLVAIISMHIIALFELNFAKYIIAYKQSGFAIYMENSIFENKPWGFGDFFTVAALLLFLFYLFNSIFKFVFLTELKAGMCTILLTLITVHALKVIIGRYRPNAILYQYSHASSMPSGHVATVFVFSSFAFIGFWQAKSGKVKRVSLAVIFIFLLLAIAMSVARCMRGMHWLTDCLASMYIVIMMSRISYYIFTPKDR